MVAANELEIRGHQGELTGKDLVVDPETGYLYHPTRTDGLTPERKKAVLKLLADGMGIEQAIHEVGVGIGQWYRHVALDKRLRQDCEAWKKAWAYRVEGVLANCAIDPKKTLDRLAYLRAHLPDVYNPVQKLEQQITITIDGNMLSQAKSERNVIEAEIVGKESANSGDNGHIISTMQGESTKGLDVQQLPNT
jgi:hypothetical protein